MKDVTKQYSIELALDLPISIDGIVLYPIQLRNLVEYYSSSRIIKLNKAQINPQYIKMSYYTFLCHYITTLFKSDRPEDKKMAESCIVFFASLFSLAMKKTVLPSFLYKEQEKTGEIKLYEIDKDNIGENAQDIYKNSTSVVTLTKENFDEMRAILVYQNEPNFVDYDKYSNDVQKLLKEEQERRSKKSTTTMEDKIDSVMACTGWNTETISNLTIRRFERIFERLCKKIDYQITKTGMMSGLVSFKDKTPLEHWTGNIENDPLKDLVTDYGSVTKNVKGYMGQV